MSVASIQVNIRLDSDTYGKVKDRATSQGIKPSEWIRALIKSEVGESSLPITGTRSVSSELETRLSILEREMIDLKSVLSIANNDPSQNALESTLSIAQVETPLTSEINDSKPNSVGASSGNGLTQKQFCKEFGTNAMTVNRWIKQGIFQTKTTKEDGSYWEKRDDGLYYHVLPN